MVRCTDTRGVAMADIFFDLGDTPASVALTPDGHGIADGPGVFVGEDARERMFARRAGFRAVPHPRLAALPPAVRVGNRDTASLRGTRYES
jgi:hypothetical protein